MWAFLPVNFILQNLSCRNNTEELAVLLHQCYRQFQYIMNKSKNYFLQTGELQKAIQMWFFLPQSNVTHFIWWGHFLAVTNNGIIGKHLINETVPLSTITEFSPVYIKLTHTTIRWSIRICLTIPKRLKANCKLTFTFQVWQILFIWYIKLCFHQIFRGFYIKEIKTTLFK